MPTINDFYQKLLDADTKLDQANANLVAIDTAINQTNATLIAGFNKLIILGQYTNLALAQIASQNDTMICIQEHIAKNTCETLNQVSIQTKLQTRMQKDVAALSDMYATVHAEAALERERFLALKAQMEECCPPPQSEPPCNYEPCPAPKSLAGPPKVPIIGDRPGGVTVT